MFPYRFKIKHQNQIGNPQVFQPHLFVVPGPTPALFGHEVDQGILILGETLGVHVAALVTLPAVADDPGNAAPVNDLRVETADSV